MDKKNPIEHLLLSRCSKFHNDGEIMQLLQNRYSASGDQKNFLILKSTDGGVARSEVKKAKRAKTKTLSLLGSMQNPDGTPTPKSNQKDSKYNPLKTRNEFKTFINTNLKYQNALVKKLKLMIKKSPNLLMNVKDICELKVCKNLLKFEDFIEMNQLWNQYMKELIGKSNNISIITSKLSTCEFIGSYIEVSQSECIDNIGMAGIVIWESQFNFIVVVPRRDNWKTDVSLVEPGYSLKEQIGGVRLLNKKNSRFRIKLEFGDNSNSQEMEEVEYDLEFEIIGNRMLVKSGDRANRKFKNHAVRDIKI